MPQTPAPNDPLAIELKFNRLEVTFGQSLEATAAVKNLRSLEVPMVIVTLPVPAGFTAGEKAVAMLHRSTLVEKVQVTPRNLVVYLRSLALNQSLEFKYRLTATVPASVTVPQAEVYEYCNPARQAATPQYSALPDDDLVRL